MNGYSYIRKNGEVKDNTYDYTKIVDKGNYLSRNFNNLALVFIKNEEFVAKTWLTDLHRIDGKLNDFYNKLFKLHGVPVYNGRGELESIFFNGAYYMNLRNPRAVEELLKANNIKDIECMELNPVYWSDCQTAINVFDDFLAHGYDNKLQYLQVNYPKYVFNSLMYLRTASFSKNTYNRDVNVFKELINSCDSLGLSGKIYERLIVNENLLDNLKYDTSYDLIDEYDIYAMVKEQFNDDLAKADIQIEIDDIYFKGAAKRTIDEIKNAGQAYIETEKGKFYLPIIKTDNTYLNFRQASDIIKKLPIQYDYTRDNEKHNDVLSVAESLGDMDLNFYKLCPRTEYEIPKEFSDLESSKDYDYDYD